MSSEELHVVFRKILLRVAADAQPSTPPSIEPEKVQTLCDGRHPAGIAPTDFSELRGSGGYLAQMAHFEAASVAAFTHLAAELDDLGAPLNLVEAAKQAARDEVVHAHAVSALAMKRGAKAPVPMLAPPPLRTLEEVAAENAAEGCVREAFGALVGLYQSVHAGASDVRVTMRHVARDEISHAALSFELHRHFLARLDVEARERVEKKREQALAELLHRTFTFEDAPWRDELGLPGADMLFDLARAFREELAPS